jgi:[NiFe] hydrogenase diaphorase moiety large subunit
MGDDLQKTIENVCSRYGKVRGRMMDVVRDVHAAVGSLSPAATELIARAMGVRTVEVESVVSFYAFFSDRPKGKFVIRLCNDVIDQLSGVHRVAQAFREELGIDFGQTTADGLFTLEWTPCIGMCDQAPAALVNEKVMTWLSSDQAREIIGTLRRTGDIDKVRHTLGSGNNSHRLVRSMVSNNIRRRGPVVFADLPAGQALHKAISMSPVEVVKQIKNSRLRGRGGAGFPAGMKWEFTRASEGAEKYVLCNADEGEPGTFKDRVILTECPDLLFEGMAIAGYAIGARHGILYLRGEYEYLRAFLESVLEARRQKKLLGQGILGKDGFDFDVRIQMGAGAYVCGEESALISSCEGRRGDPKNRPPFPAQRGYLGFPTSINNVETFCAAARVLDEGAAWFAEIGTKESAGTKLFSISGDCQAPGVYELPFGVTLRELIDAAGGSDVVAAQVGGPSGQMVGRADFERKLSYEDLATGGAVMVFGPGRDLLEIVRGMTEFFVDESCGYCTPCRVGNRLLLQGVNKVLAGHAEEKDLADLEALGQMVKTASRCGLGQTSPNPVLTTLRSFRPEYQRRLGQFPAGRQPTFDLHKAVLDAEAIAGRPSIHHNA